MCRHGRCIDGAIVAGPALRNEAIRKDYLDRRIAEISLFEGGRAPQSRMQLLRDTIEGLFSEASSGTFWPTLGQAYAGLIDGHASAPIMGYPGRLNAGICLHEGEADLLPTSLVGDGVLPLVFVVPDSEIGARLREGDAVIAIDGLTPALWAERAARALHHPGDPAGRSVVIAPQLLTAAVDAGSVITFARCGGPEACTEETTETFSIDFGAELGDAMFGGEFPVWSRDYVDCDFRFRHAVEVADAREYTHAAYADLETGAGLGRVLQINGVPSEQMEGGAEWFAVVRDAVTAVPARGLVLDQRLGGGGSMEAVDLLMGALLDSDDFWAMEVLPNLEGDVDMATIEGLRACVAANQTGEYGCGIYLQWVLGGSGGLRGVASQGKLAVVNANDVSGNDFTSRLATFRGAETRFFGDGATWGAFGVIWSLPSHIGEVAGGSFQVHDTLFYKTPTDNHLEFATSTGVRPDEVVRQKQSDALLGVDTVLQAALNWLAE